MHHVAPADSLSDRSSRAPFKYPVRVTIAGQRTVRVLSGDISNSGMFLLMAEPPESGTVVTLAFEVRGQVLPFAEGEVAWTRSSGTRGGFGVRFTRFLHPRARALIDFLCENIEEGTMLKPQPPPPAMRRRWTGLSALAAVGAFVITTGSTMPPPPERAEPVVKNVIIDPSLVCRAEVGQVQCPEPAAPPVVVAAKKTKVAEAPKPAPVVTRTLLSAAKPARFSSTPIPSGAARLVTLSRVSGQVRVAVDAVAGGQVSSVRAFSSPPRIVIDVTGIAPIAEHRVAINDPEVLSVVATPLGKVTRLTVLLARMPKQVVQQGDTALVGY